MAKAKFERTKPHCNVGTIGHVDDTGRANYHGLLVSGQRRLAGGFSLLANWTLSKCVGDPATTEITGPTIVDPSRPELDYSHCDSDRRHVVNISSVVNIPAFRRALLGHLFSNWQLAPIVRWQSGGWSSVTLGIDRALTGMGGQRAVQVLDNPYGDKTPDFYLNPAAFAMPEVGTYSNLKRNTIANPPRLQNDVAITRTFKVGSNRTVQFRWEIFNVLNHVNFDPPVTALNSPNFGKILSAGDPRIMQFALKFTF